MKKELVLDWNEYLDTARKMAAEGCVLLKNNDNVLPFENGSKISVFGRIAAHYYKSGTGSGGMVNVSHVTNLLEGLRESKLVSLNEELVKIYEEWEETHPIDEGIGWGKEPWSQEEMLLSDEIVKKAAESSDAALVVIGRTAGEDRDNSNTKGAYMLSDLEEDMLKKVRSSFDKVVVALNVGGIIDMSFIDKYNPDSVIYIWHGGMTGGHGAADVLTGKVNACGKLPDTIAFDIEDYPSTPNFGNPSTNDYVEDIFVGYRYFETFAKDRVRFPFGFGLSYTKFDISIEQFQADAQKRMAGISVNVKNTGKYAGKEVVQVYVKAPNGKLGKAARCLAAFEKTTELIPGANQVLEFTVELDKLASYDDSGITGNKNCFILEKGSYEFFTGSDVRSASYCGKLELDKDFVVEKLEEALAPVKNFKRFKAVEKDGETVIEMEDVPTLSIDEKARRQDGMPTEIPYTGDKGIKLVDVLEKRNSMEEFVAQFSDENLASIIRGEGMGSFRVTPGTAAAFGGVSDELVAFGIPALCCDDGPSGLRIDCGTKAFSIPIGTLIAASFNLELTTQLFTYLAKEMIFNNVECLLGPGMNIHRHPLNGRNFEYFSEDPFLTGIMACAELKGLHSYGVTGTIKHFCGNNQETKRHSFDSVISQRALREIYLKGFEMAVKDAGVSTIMTTYGSVNGLWTAGSYDLNTTILREQWGYKGVTMTDWWADINERNKPQDKSNFAAMARAQNDLYMVCPDSSQNRHGDNTIEALSNGTLNRSELQRNAMNICKVAMESQAMKRLMGLADYVTIINRPADEDDMDAKNLKFIEFKESLEFDLSTVESKKGTNYVFALDVENLGGIKFTISGESDLDELAQIPCSLFYSNIPVATFTFNGTNGKEVDISKKIVMPNRFTIIKIHVGANGLRLKKFKMELGADMEHLTDEYLKPY